MLPALHLMLCPQGLPLACCHPGLADLGHVVGGIQWELGDVQGQGQAQASLAHVLGNLGELAAEVGVQQDPFF